MEDYNSIIEEIRVQNKLDKYEIPKQLEEIKHMLFHLIGQSLVYLYHKKGGMTKCEFNRKLYRIIWAIENMEV